MFASTQSACKDGTLANINDLYSALTSDIISNYAFGPSESALERPDLNQPLFRACMEASEGYHISSYLPFLPKIYATLPLPVVKLMLPKVTVFVDLITVKSTNYGDDIFVLTCI